MSQVRLSADARLDLQRLYNFLSEKDVNAADRAVATIIESFGLLESIPLSGKAIDESRGMRKHVISFGATGYIALYRYTEHDDCAVIARIYHQKEDYRADINSKLL